MDVLTIGLLQMTSRGNEREANLEKGVAFCRRARDHGCDIALFPEMWNVGYYAVPPDDTRAHIDELRSLAIPDDSDFVRTFESLAKELAMVIAVTYLAAASPADPPQGTMRVVDSDGRVALQYAKVHTCDFDMGVIYQPGDTFPVGTVHTRAGPLKVGGMLCYDREFPETARILMLGGAELILTANCCTLDGKRLNQFQARAFENATAVAMSNYAAPQCNGCSVAFDAGGELAVLAGPMEGLYPAIFDMSAIRAYRRTCGWGNAYRRPRKYGPLVSDLAEEPFLRTDALGRPFDRTMR